jgi:hypothetical protein
LRNVLAVILNNDVAGAQIEESTDQVLCLKEGSQHGNQLLFSFFCVNEFFIFSDNLVALSKSIFSVLLAHLGGELLKVTGV